MRTQPQTRRSTGHRCHTTSALHHTANSLTFSSMLSGIIVKSIAKRRELRDKRDTSQCRCCLPFVQSSLGGDSHTPPLLSCLWSLFLFLLATLRNGESVLWPKCAREKTRRVKSRHPGPVTDILARERGPSCGPCSASPRRYYNSRNAQICHPIVRTCARAGADGNEFMGCA